MQGRLHVSLLSMDETFGTFLAYPQLSHLTTSCTLSTNTLLHDNGGGTCGTRAKLWVKPLCLLSALCTFRRSCWTWP